MKHIILTIFFLTFIPCYLLAQGVTTSAMSGTVTDDNQEPLIRATVLATHIPSGTQYGAATDRNGHFRIPGMRVGGPYNVRVSYTGYSSYELENLSLRLGETERRNFELSEQVIDMDAITVTATAGSAGQNSGTSTQISSRNLEDLPTLDRGLNDFLRLTPQSSAYGGSGITFAGMNNRYNALYIDGAVNNDVFGLAASGTHGGQTGISPFSLDIVEQVQTVISPYDVSMGGFAGGGINAVTKSGTNTFSASAYNYVRNENLVGKTNRVQADRLGVDREQVEDFTERQFGVSASGPIIEDRLFFFTNVEVQRDATPAPFNVQEYTSHDERASTGDLDRLREHLLNTYDYDPGTFGNTSRDLDGLKFFGKLDFNISPNHFLTLRHQYTKAEQFSRRAGSSSRINFSNNGIYFPSVTNSSAIELNSIFGQNHSNNLTLSYVRVRDDRGTLGDRFPYVSIADGGGGSIEFGSEQFSTANQLDQDIFTLTNNFQIFRGNHTITLGTHNEFYSIYNLFLRQNFGYYEFDSIDDFINNEAPSFYTRTYALDGDGAADFNAIQFGLYAQNEWMVNDNLTLTAGLRLDLPYILDDPVEDSYFNNTALPAIQEAYDIAENTRAGSAPDGQLMFSPRLGFQYATGSRFDNVIRGGLGLFTSRIPFVWPGAMFTNNGLTAGGVSLSDLDDDFRFIADPDGQPTNPQFVTPSGQMDLFVEDFKYPQIFRTNLATDFTLPGDITTTLEAIYTKTINNITYSNVNSDPTVDFSWTGSADNRPVYVGESIDPTYNAVYLASNTSKGYTYNLSASFAKNFDFGLNATLAYSYGDARALSEGTSSQNSSQWRGQVNVDGRNNPDYGRSDFAAGHRFISALSYRYQWTNSGSMSTTFSLFMNAQSGIPHSYVIGGFGARNLNNETGSTGRNRSLAYIPESFGDINLVDYESNGQTITAAEQWERLDNLIEDDRYLRNNRGQYAEKNGAWGPFTALFDVGIRQEFGLLMGGQMHRFQVSADIQNVGNLLNSEWGTNYAIPGDFNNYYLYNFEGYAEDGTTPEFTFRDGETGVDRYDIDGGSSRWRMLFGVRYLFN